MMNEENDLPNNPLLTRAFSELKHQIPMAPEILLAYARGELTPETAAKVETHLKSCPEAAESFRLVQKFLETTDPDQPSGDAETARPVSLPPKLKSKVELLAALYAKRDRIVENIAQKLLPEKSWAIIRPTIMVAKSLDAVPTTVPSTEPEALPLAAFSAEVSPEEKKDYEVVLQVLRFVDMVNELLVQRCNGIEDLERELPGCVQEAAQTLGKVTFDEDTRKMAIEVILENLRNDDKGSQSSV
jgi:hypothetical protein